MSDSLEDQRRERARQLAAEFADRGDSVGWFEAFYREAAGDNKQIPWADLEPNKFLRTWSEKNHLQGNGRKALVVGCGLGDDAKYLHDLGFEVTAFDISPTAIGWAKRIHAESSIVFQVADLFEPPAEWRNAFDFVLEVYTIQPLPLEMRERVIDAIAAFVGEAGEVLVVTRGREDDEEPVELPWALSRKDLSRFETHHLLQADFQILQGDEDPPLPRFVVHYKKRA